MLRLDEVGSAPRRARDRRLAHARPGRRARGARCLTRSSSGCGARAACTPRTRRRCCARPGRDERPRAGSCADARPASRWRSSSAGRSSAGCGSTSTRSCSSRAGAPSSWRARRSSCWRRGAGRRRVVVDLCCGTGAVAAVVASAYDDLELHAVDVEPHAVACARRNLAPPAEVHEGDLDAALPARLRGARRPDHRQRAYVPTAELEHLPRESREHEPRDHGRRRAPTASPAPADRPGGGGLAAPGRPLVLETSPRRSTARSTRSTSAGLALARTVADDDLDAVVVVATCHRSSRASERRVRAAAV